MLAGANLPAHFQAVQPRQHQIEDDEIGQVHLGLAEAFLAVVGDQSFKAFLVEVVGEHLAQVAFVFDDEDARFGHIDG